MTKELPRTSRGGSQGGCGEGTQQWGRERGIGPLWRDEEINPDPNTGFAPLCSCKALPKDLLAVPWGHPCRGVRGELDQPLHPVLLAHFKGLQKTSARLFV